MRQAEEKKDTSAVVESAASTSAVSSEDTTMADAEKAKVEAKKDEGVPKRAGIVLAAEKRVTSKLLDKEAGGGREKLFTVNECVDLLPVSGRADVGIATLWQRLRALRQTLIRSSPFRETRLSLTLLLTTLLCPLSSLSSVFVI